MNALLEKLAEKRSMTPIERLLAASPELSKAKAEAILREICAHGQRLERREKEPWQPK